VKLLGGLLGHHLELYVSHRGHVEREGWLDVEEHAYFEVFVGVEDAAFVGMLVGLGHVTAAILADELNRDIVVADLAAADGYAVRQLFGGPQSSHGLVVLRIRLFYACLVKPRIVETFVPEVPLERQAL
jgi:hypothetical protein